MKQLIAVLGVSFVMERVKNCSLVLWYGMLLKPEKPVCDVVFCNVVLLPSKNKVSCELRQWFLGLREDFVSHSVEGDKNTKVKMDVLLSKSPTVSHWRRSKIACPKREL